MTSTTGRRHYEHVADILRRAVDAGLDPITITIIAMELADLFKHNHSGFQYRKFYAAVGIEIPQCHQHE